jgi:hypothetical protein
MSTSIYLYKTHQINISNLALAQALENADTKCFDRCHYIFDDKFLKVVTGDFVNSYPSIDFRTIDWSTTINSLERYQQRAQQQEKFLIFGSSRDDQINFLKQHFSNTIITIGIDYDDTIYQKLLYNLAEHHLYKLKHNQILVTDHDKEILNSLSDVEAVQHYVDGFDQLALIPQSSNTIADYHISIGDFIDKNKMSTHYNNLNIPFTNKSHEFYNEWSTRQSII